MKDDTLGRTLLAWYDRHHRTLPWRTGPADREQGLRNDPYRVWLSEIMLQQTTVQAVKPYFTAFLERWPTVDTLAAATEDEVMQAWAGLGYYSRARNLKACAETVSHRLGGRFPDTVDGLRSLPGIGEYTAAAIAAIAFDRAAVVVDGNVERVVTRLHAIDVPLPAAKPAIREHVAAMLPEDRPGDFAQAMMDLGATICTPRRPACALCPLDGGCEARRRGDQERFPVKIAKAEKPVRRGAAFVARRTDGAILLRKRPPKGLLAAMAEPPGTGWTARVDGGTSVADAPFPAAWHHAGTIRHVFTHFALDLEVYRADGRFDDLPEGHWWSLDIEREALPSVMKNAVKAALQFSPPAKRGRP